jgi:DUF2075 family protein/predicted GIY-YIG superfamily endonuclease
MTGYRIEGFPFKSEAVTSWGINNERSDNWPVVYTLSSEGEIYVGETINAEARLGQHLHSSSKKSLRHVQIILNDTFNKSVCLDLESHLIRYFAADGKHRVLNANAGISDANYFNREEYRQSFKELFDELVAQGMLSRPIPEIVNSNLFKFSPFKALNSDQAIAVSALLEKLIDGMRSSTQPTIVIQGDPGTGKTIVAIYLIKLLRDIATISGDELLEEDSIFSEYFTEENRALLSGLKLALVVPQQSLRATLQRVFKQTPGLSKDMVLTPFEAGASDEPFDLLIVDEAHRLGQRANQSSASLNKKFSEVNFKLFGEDRKEVTQLDWIKANSKAQVLMLDTEQAIKPADLPIKKTKELIQAARSNDQLFRLTSQMRVAGGNGYLEFVKALFTDNPLPAASFTNYDFRVFDDFAKMKKEIEKLNSEQGLARLVAGFAWPWNSKDNPKAHDIEIQGIKLQWNQTVTDWVNSPTSINEVGSIHTIQGYDLNYAGVIIGNDLTFDSKTGKFRFNRDSYFDKKGKENNPTLGKSYSDEDLLQFVINIYKVLLTRGVKGTFVYVLDPRTREIFQNLHARKISRLSRSV